MEAVLFEAGGKDGGVEELFAANLEAFKEHAPYLYKRLAAIETPHSELLTAPDGSVDMALMGNPFYGCDARQFAEKQLEAYFKQPQRFTLAEPNPQRLEGLNGGFCNSLTEGARDLGISFNHEHCPVDAHFLLVFGIGLGLHVHGLIERTQARVVCLVESNLESIHHSMRIVDWRSILAQFEEEGRELTIIVEREPKLITRKLQTLLRRNLVTFIDGIYLFTHFRSAILQQSLDLFRKDLAIPLAGLGYFEDEVIMTANAVSNMAGRTVKLLCYPHTPKDVPVFIVGSGPSVESDLDFLVANQDRAMIFTIGTGLRVLLARGVTPDYHIEIENSEFNVGLMAATVGEFDVSGVTLVASATVRPGMVELFGDAFLFFREVLSSTKLFAGDLRILQPAGPTVANAALAAGIRMGFREYFLFGVDMGTRSEGRFHAEGSVYSLGLFKDYSEEDNRFPGNFGGEVLGERLLNWSRNTLESAIIAQPDITVYNCSDGAKISGAIPKVSRAIEMSGPPIDREAVKRQIAQYVLVATPERTAGHWCLATRQAELAGFLERVESILAKVPDQADPQDDWLRETAGVVKQTAPTNPIVTSYLSGTLQIMAGVTMWYDRRIEDAGQRAAFRRYASGVLLQSVRRIGGELSELYEEVEDHFSGRRRIDGLHPDCVDLLA